MTKSFHISQIFVNVIHVVEKQLPVVLLHVGIRVGY